MSKKALVFMGIALAMAGGVFYGTVIEPNQLEINHVWIETPLSGKALEGRIAVHLSDLHMARFGEKEALILETIDKIKPDFIFLTGDYVKWKGDYEPALDFLSKLKAKIGVWAVMGDYDYSNSRKSCLFCHEPGRGERTRRHSATFLRNTIGKIDLENGSIWVGGIDSRDHEFDIAKAGDFLGRVDSFAIVLNHNPLHFGLLDPDQDVLILSGDTHGGQIPVPSGIWERLGYEKCARYEQGLFKKDRKMMFVNRGVGVSHLPIRILRKPEMVVLHF